MQASSNVCSNKQAIFLKFLPQALLFRLIQILKKIDPHLLCCLITSRDSKCSFIIVYTYLRVMFLTCDEKGRGNSIVSSLLTVIGYSKVKPQSFFNYSSLTLANELIKYLTFLPTSKDTGSP